MKFENADFLETVGADGNFNLAPQSFWDDWGYLFGNNPGEIEETFFQWSVSSIPLASFLVLVTEDFLGKYSIEIIGGGVGLGDLTPNFWHTVDITEAVKEASGRKVEDNQFIAILIAPSISISGDSSIKEEAEKWIIEKQLIIQNSPLDHWMFLHTNLIEFDSIKFRKLKIQLNHDEVQATAAHLPFLSVETGNMPAVID